MRWVHHHIGSLHLLLLRQIVDLEQCRPQTCRTRAEGEVEVKNELSSYNCRGRASFNKRVFLLSTESGKALARACRDRLLQKVRRADCCF